MTELTNKYDEDVIGFDADIIHFPFCHATPSAILFWAYADGDILKLT